MCAIFLCVYIYIVGRRNRHPSFPRGPRQSPTGPVPTEPVCVRCARSRPDYHEPNTLSVTCVPAVWLQIRGPLHTIERHADPWQGDGVKKGTAGAVPELHNPTVIMTLFGCVSGYIMPYLVLHGCNQHIQLYRGIHT